MRVILHSARMMDEPLDMVQKMAKIHLYADLDLKTPTEMVQEITALRKGIQDYLDGDYGRDQFFKTKHDKCPHGLFGWEACENCIDAHFTKLLTTPAVTSKEG